MPKRLNFLCTIQLLRVIVKSNNHHVIKDHSLKQRYKGNLFVREDNKEIATP